MERKTSFLGERGKSIYGDEAASSMPYPVPTAVPETRQSGCDGTVPRGYSLSLRE